MRSVCFARLLSIVLVAGLAPLPALAAPVRLQAGSTPAADADADGAGPVDVTFDAKTQQGLYDAIVEQLGKQGLACETDDASLCITIPATSNAAFTTLDASHRSITSIAGLEQFTGLVWLDLSNNLVQTSSQFSGMKRLAHLDLYDNRVRDLSGLRASRSSPTSTSATTTSAVGRRWKGSTRPTCRRQTATSST